MSAKNIVKFTLNNEKAVTPTKGEKDSVGYDLTAISVYKKYGSKITLFETGISVEPPPGYFTEILPRSSLSKTGYVLANSVGLIDPSYRGTLKITLLKIDNTLPDLVPPFCKCQLIMRKHHDFNMKQVQENTLSKTIRGSGGFGSTDSNCLRHELTR